MCRDVCQRGVEQVQSRVCAIVCVGGRVRTGADVVYHDIIYDHIYIYILRLEFYVRTEADEKRRVDRRDQHLMGDRSRHTHHIALYRIVLY